MSLLDNLLSFLPFKKQNVTEYFFALNIGLNTLKTCLWEVNNGNLQVTDIASGSYESDEEILNVTDQLLDQTLGQKNIEPQKILFGVPNSWLQDDNLKEPYLKLLKDLVKNLNLKPIAYVSTSNALTNFLEKSEGAPTTAIIVGIMQDNIIVNVARAGKLDGTKHLKRGDNIGEDIEKLLLQFSEVEVLPSKILLFGDIDMEKQKDTLLQFPWMNKLSFLHLPKIDLLEKDIEIKSIALAGANEFQTNIRYASSLNVGEIIPEKDYDNNLGFIAGDISTVKKKEEIIPPEKKEEVILPKLPKMDKIKSLLELQGRKKLILPIAAIIIFILAYVFLLQATITIFVEPRTLERDTQVTADPNAKLVDEDKKIIPGQIIETQISGSDKIATTGKKQIGDASKGTVKIINNSSDAQTLSRGTVLASNNLKFTLDTTINVASTSATADTKSTTTAPVTAMAVGADGNLSSGTQFSSPNTQVAIIAEGNFSGGTSKEVAVVTDSDQKKLLASLAAELRKKASDSLQTKLNGKKILEEALLEEIISKSYSKNINDQATEFSLNLTIKYKGTAYSDEDLKTIVSKLVETNVPADFELNLAQTETQADVSSLQKDGRLIFLARFKAKLMPKLDIPKIKDQIRGRSTKEAVSIIQNLENVLESEIVITPKFPSQIERLPILDRNIKIEVKLK